MRACSLRDCRALARRALLPLQALPTTNRFSLLSDGSNGSGLVQDRQGAELVGSWRPPDGWEKFFCTECGSQLYTTDPEQPERLSVRMGALDADPGIRPSAHQFTDYAAAWEPIPDDGLPRFPERLPGGMRPPQSEV